MAAMGQDMCLDEGADTDPAEEKTRESVGFNKL